MFAKQETDVLVVGAGPVGQLTALRLASRGVKVTVFDKHWRIGAHSYALALHPDSLTLLDEIGVTTELLGHGLRVDKVGFYEGDRRVCEVSLAELGGKYPFVLVLPQSRLESALEKRLTEHKVKVLWNHRLEQLNLPSLTAEIAKLDRVACGYPIAQMEWVVVKTFETRAKFVVGADGYHSVVRERLGIKLQEAAPPQSFSVFEFEAPGDLGNELRVVLDNDRTSVLWPMSQNRCRWSFQISDPDQHESTRDHLNSLIRERAPWFPLAEGEIYWSSAVMFAQRLADSFGRDNVWLVGDAAHLTSPVGVQSMNSGLLEARQLGDRIADILESGGTPALLDEYASDRRAEWRFLLGMDRPREPSKDVDPWVRKRAQRILTSLPATGKAVHALLGQLGLGS